MDAVWNFFDNFYWPVRYKKTYLANRADFLVDQGIRHVVLLVQVSNPCLIFPIQEGFSTLLTCLLALSIGQPYRYAHKNGIARDLNKFLATTVDDMNDRYAQIQIKQSLPRRRVASGLATVMPGEPGAKEILAEAFTTLKLSGIKMHSHVQCVPANHPSMDEVYETCVRFDKPVLIHAGKEPNSSAYKVDAGKICDSSIVEDVLKRYPRMNQYQEFFDLLDRYPNLYLDTTMTFGSFFESMDGNKPLAQLIRTMLLKHSDRIMYGTDWPNIPYDWCRELANLISVVDGDGEATNISRLAEESRGQSRTAEGDSALEQVLWKNAAHFYGISEAELGLESRSEQTPFTCNL
ncbi:hypothetical protein BGZ98_005096 [Dissophora globulifera]|nr:hypothetical protein BGZ98_005096 [Dissophora globulifera]